MAIIFSSRLVQATDEHQHGQVLAAGIDLLHHLGERHAAGVLRGQHQVLRLGFDQ
jgi:hypothetical protein